MKYSPFLEDLAGGASQGLGCFFSTILFILGIPVQIVIWAFHILWIIIMSIAYVFAFLFITLPRKIRIKRYREKCGKLQMVFAANKAVAYKQFLFWFGTEHMTKKYLTTHYQCDGEEHWRFNFKAKVFIWETIVATSFEEDWHGVTLDVHTKDGEIQELDICED